MKKNLAEQYWFVIENTIKNSPSVYSETDKYNMEITINTICKYIDCKICKTHFKEYIIKYPIKCNTKKEIQTWVLNFKKSTKSRNLSKKKDALAVIINIIIIIIIDHLHISKLLVH